jgi:hypothetical protein
VALRFHPYRGVGMVRRLMTLAGLPVPLVVKVVHGEHLAGLSARSQTIRLHGTSYEFGGAS